MTKLQEKQKAARAELNRINIQIIQEELREGAAENIQKVSRLLIDLENSVTFCRLPMTTSAHIKLAHSSEFCDPSKCFHAGTCREILQLTRKGKGKNKRKSNGNGSTKKADIEIKKEYPTFGKAVYTISGKRFDCHYTNWENYKNTINIRSGGYRKEMEAAGATPQQVSGLIHFNGMHKALGL